MTRFEDGFRRGKIPAKQLTEHKFRRWKHAIFLACTGIAVAGCGSKNSKKKVPQTNQEQNPTGLAKIYFNLTESDPNETTNDTMALGAASDFSASIVGCKSGFQRTGITPATNDLFVQRNDSDCVFRLDTLTVNGENFSFQSQTQWGSGTSFEVTGSAGTVIRLAVTSNIKPRITEDQNVAMNFSSATQGTPTNIGARIGVAVSIVGADPVLLEISQLDVIVTSDGAGQFTATLNCATPVETGRCGQITMSGLRFGLVANGAPSLNLAECRSIALGATGKLQGTELPIGTPGAANGGLSLSRLKGPTPLYGAGNDKLYLAAADTSSSFGACKYYRILVRPTF